MKLSSVAKAVLVTCGVALGGAASADGPSATMLAYTCAGCHGTGGISNGPATPTIAGLSTEYFVETMMGYKNGDRTATIMTRIAKGYSDADFARMAEFFAGQSYVMSTQKSDAAKAAKGEKLHDKYCEKCHAEIGTEVEDDSGFLAGQWMPYLQYTMHDFMNGGREMTKKMKKKVEKLHKKEGDAGIEALLHYYASKN